MLLRKVEIERCANLRYGVETTQVHGLKARASRGESVMTARSVASAGWRAVPFVQMVKAGEEWGTQEIPSDMFGGVCLICEIKIIPPAWLCFVMIGDKCAKFFKKHSRSSTNGT